jgi:hypothetical protein
MRNAIRIAGAGIALAALILGAFDLMNQIETRKTWQQESGPDNTSILPPRELTIAELYRLPLAPSRRVRLREPTNVRDTLRTIRPIVGSDGVVREISEELIFLEDPRTGHRMAILQTSGTPTNDWIELTPMPRNVSLPPRVSRWTPLMHWSDIWLSGWADANEPIRTMWLGLTSDVIRMRDISGDPAMLPYQIGETIRAGAPGGPAIPGYLSALGWIYLIVVIAGIGGVVAVGRDTAVG